ncbi:MAG: metallophosphoesterase [Clostridia bacterium]|nr:metallophosphoesterase [Clostridia bacterium]
MKLYAIGDLHLDGKQNKPMDVFGPLWQDHRERIFAAWHERVTESDAVLLPGDFCWAMQFRDAMDDLIAVSELPGLKLLIRGNHDYWWASPTKMREALPPRVRIIQNDASDIGPAVIAGTRGWLLRTSPEFGEKDDKIFRRELIRLEMSLEAALRLSRKDGAAKPIVLMLHYPPLAENGAETEFTELIRRYPVQRVVYGHLHGPSCRMAFEGEREGIRYELVSADRIGFAPRLIEDFPDPETEN